MRISASQRESSERCPLCFTGLTEGEAPYRCSGCRVHYHRDCADELGGCATLGCAQNGIGPNGPASLEQIRRHMAGVQAGDVQRGRWTGPPGAAYESQRADAIREALLEQRARLIAQRNALARYEREKVRNARLKLIAGFLLLIATLYFMLRGTFI